MSFAIHLKVETRLENPTRLYMLQSQKRKVRQFLSSGDIEAPLKTEEERSECNNVHETASNKETINGITSRTPTTSGLLAVPPTVYPMLTASAPAKNCSTYSKYDSNNSGEILDQGNLLIFQRRMNSSFCFNKYFSRIIL